MLLTIFSPVYEALCGAHPDYTAEYRGSIFGSVGTITLAIIVAMLLLFYVVLGRWKMVWFNLIHWGVTVLITAIICFFIAYLSAKNVLELVDGYVWRFAVINAIYTAVIFILLSLIFKNLSVFSKRTPF
ncbi:hypothetical protein [Mucilaginibacter auburnensis]|uniref:Uncharacterized protein n=1 Tax=Mucilaginibacter auburnensis TaxID=1457233 RepID=A0A2H9VRU2_9SPHI|nr:hypothetical protein [Mucilaginibacter auburnensis]PJJ83518.1 hypothetical protein CLV57_0501 [Mucilaginibacter auburnensis]